MAGGWAHGSAALLLLSSLSLCSRYGGFYFIAFHGAFFLGSNLGDSEGVGALPLYEAARRWFAIILYNRQMRR
jgi:hypothetical protein